MDRDSILNSIKKMLGLEADYTAFDTDIIVDINSVLAILGQLGVGPLDGFQITGPDETWNDFLGDSTLLEHVKTYVYLKVQMMFDPPSIGSVVESKNKLISELEWRINVSVETPMNT